MAIAFSNLGASSGTETNPDISDSTDATSYANSAWTPPTSGLIFCFVYNLSLTNPAIQPTMSGNGITWTFIQTDVFTTSRLSLFGANGSGSSNGVTTVDCGAETQTALHACFAAATGVDLSGGVAAAFVQAPHNQGGTGTASSVTLSSAGDAANRPIFGNCLTGPDVRQTPRASWTELDDLGIGTAGSLETQYRDDAFETSASSTWAGSTGWRAIAAELKADLGGAGTVLDPMGMRGFFGA